VRALVTVRVRRRALGKTLTTEHASIMPPTDIHKMKEAGVMVGVLSRGDPRTDDILGLEELVTYGIKGLAAYSAHAAALGKVRRAGRVSLRVPVNHSRLPTDTHPPHPLAHTHAESHTHAHRRSRLASVEAA
jgi:hypothetical protein